MEQKDKLIVTLYKNNGKNDPAVFNWIADSHREAINIIEKTIKEIREDFRQQGWNEEEYDFPGEKTWYKNSRGKRNYCLLYIDECYYEFYITDVEDKTKNFFWDCK